MRACPPVAMALVSGPSLAMMRSMMPSISADGAEVQAGLHAGDGVGADDVLGRAEIDQGQARGLAEERVDGDADADGDGAAQVFGVARDDVEVDGGAEIAR